MCYSGRCPYEDYFGECRKPRGVQCPETIDDDDDMNGVPDDDIEED